MMSGLHLEDVGQGSLISDLPGTPPRCQAVKLNRCS